MNGEDCKKGDKENAAVLGVNAGVEDYDWLGEYYQLLTDIRASDMLKQQLEARLQRILTEL